MSDSEYSYEYSTGDEGSGAEDGGAEDDGLIEIENTFCEAEGAALCAQSRRAARRAARLRAQGLF